jgi:hypothetical protein
LEAVKSDDGRETKMIRMLSEVLLSWEQKERRPV